jgi:DNA-binding NarL/FixJ family response regulator
MVPYVQFYYLLCAPGAASPLNYLLLMNTPDISINVCIADDQQVFRNGLIVSMQPYPRINIISGVGSGELLLDMLQSSDTLPDVLLLDIKMKKMDGMEITRAIRKKYPSIKVIGLSMYENSHYIIQMFKAGANAYLVKNADPAEIAEAIEGVMQNNFYFSPLVSAAFLRNIMETNQVSLQAVQSEFNQNEQILLRLICDEFTNNEIADKMNLSIKTIENYRNRLLLKTGAKNTAGLVMYAVKNGYLILDEVPDQV